MTPINFTPRIRNSLENHQFRKPSISDSQLINVQQEPGTTRVGGITIKSRLCETVRPPNFGLSLQTVANVIRNDVDKQQEISLNCDFYQWFKERIEEANFKEWKARPADQNLLLTANQISLITGISPEFDEGWPQMEEVQKEFRSKPE